MLMTRSLDSRSFPLLDQNDVKGVVEGLAASQPRGREDVAKLKVMTFTTNLPETVQSIDKDVYLIFLTIRHCPKE